MTKLKISQKQYNTILLREQEDRLKVYTAILNENLDQGTELLEEGWKEVVLGVAMMLGVGLTGQNKAIAQDAVKNAQTMAQVKATLEDENKVKELADAMKEKGMKDPSTMLSTNAEKIIDTYNKIADDNHIKYKVDVKAVNNLQALNSKLKQGYALTKSDISNDTTHTDVSTVTSVQDTLDVNLGSDNLFVTAGYTLSPAGVDTITISINEIKKQGGKIISVDIESSTDAEEIVKFKSKDDPTGNIKLADLRTKSVADMIGTLESGVSITHREIPNNGSDVVSTQDFLRIAKDKKATAALRLKTHKYRYVKIKIIATFEHTDTTTTKPDDIIKNYRFEVVKVIETTAKTHKISNHVHFKNKKFKCKKGKKLHHVVNACTTFN